MFSNTEAGRFKNRPTGLYSLHGMDKNGTVYQNTCCCVVQQEMGPSLALPASSDSAQGDRDVQVDP